MESKVVKNELPKLNKFLDSLVHANQYVVRVGIMGQKNARPDEKGQTNADIGFIHEYGRLTSKPPIPQRSFLYMPLRVKANSIINEVQQYINLAMKDGKLDIFKTLQQFGIACQRKIDDAFSTKGFGTWRKNSPVTLAHKRGTMPLIDLGYLAKSITSEVVKK